MDTREIATSRGKTALYLAMSLAFVAIALFGLQDPDRASSKLQLCLAFFGLCSVVFVWLLIRPQRLLLDSEGFTLLGGFVRSPKKVCWCDIDAFFVYRLPRGGKMIGFNYRPDAPRGAVVRFARRLGAEGTLPKGWPIGPDKMVAELNAFRLQALDARGAGHS
jgi:hypothetical protein